MNCPVCGAESRVLDTRTADDGESIRRRRECLADACRWRFTTYERIEQRVLVVVKKDGRRQAFDGAKIRRGVERACTKRPISPERIDRLVANLEAELRRGSRRTVAVEELSTLVLKHLRELDEVAYLRFASVNREFDSAEQFLTEAQELGGTEPETT
ncbi:MAG TPA: transcriptional regulator NrdR [Armatimonadetes bacterium]|nr:transcriptional regulator NrdR [Armatimonadota bacterium]